MFITKYLILFNFLFIYAYDEILTKRAVDLAEASYCISTIDNWNCTTCDNNIFLTNVIEKKGVRALQGYDSITDCLFISYRGSSNIENWIDNIRIKKISPYNDSNIKVAKGFYNEHNVIKSDLIDNLSILTDKYKTKNIFLTGHSSGAALATLMGFDILSMYTNYNLLYLITFGSPRIGNKDFSYFFNDYNITSYRVTHNNDMVPHLPEEMFGYLHISNEIWYNEENSEYKICNDKYNEDSTCSNSCSPLHCTSTSDHLNYLNISMGNDN
tara:strand:+ start:3273 stop:4082 length:810 start_codon:yes stop_codon:yes gene_type:complete